METEDYEKENLRQPESETDTFSAERYKQFSRHRNSATGVVLDVGCGNGNGGKEFKALVPRCEMWGLDVVQSRLDSLPSTYERRLRSSSTRLPVDGGVVSTILAGEFLEHLLPADVDVTLCEFQRVLTVGGRLMLTTPNPGYLRLRLTGGTVYGPGHLTQHVPRVLKLRLQMHGFSRVRVFGSGKVTRYLPERFPIRAAFGSYLVVADKR